MRVNVIIHERYQLRWGDELSWSALLNGMIAPAPVAGLRPCALRVGLNDQGRYSFSVSLCPFIGLPL